MTADNEHIDDKESVLFVDDESNILSSLKRLVKPLGVRCHIANSGPEALALLEEQKIDLIISDMRMPEMDGATFLTQAKKLQPDTVRMLLTGFADIDSTIHALNEGEISRYISKPWNDQELLQIINEGLKIKRLEKEKQALTELTQQQNEQLIDLNKNLEAKVEHRTQQIRESSKKLDTAYTELKNSYDSFVRVFSTFVNARPALRKAESEIVADLALTMAKALKLNEDLCQATYYAALLHQIGKASFSDDLLAKSEAELKEDERRLFQQYPVVGETTLSAIHGFEKTSQLIRNHTELYDGSGYPDGLEGNRVRSGSRILRVAKDYIGLQTGTVLEGVLSAEAAMEKILNESGSKYDPIVVKCLQHFHKDYVVSSMYADEICVQSMKLVAGMRLTRDVLNSKGLLLLSKGFQLSEEMISKIIALEKAEDANFSIFVAKDTPTNTIEVSDNTFNEDVADPDN